MELSIEQIQACNEVAKNCDKCLVAISKIRRFNTVYLRSFKQCEEICLTFLHAVSHHSVFQEKLALLTIGLCEECAEICDELVDDRIFKNAAVAIRRCSTLLSKALTECVPAMVRS